MNAFHWRKPADVPEHAGKYPQLAWYWRKKAGLTGTREKPVRGWRERIILRDNTGSSFCTPIPTQADSDRTASIRGRG